MLRSTPDARWAALLITATFLAYGLALVSGFVLDDVPILIDNPQRVADINYLSFFTHSVWDHTAENSNSFIYRPLFMLYMALSQSLWGDNPFGYHLASLLLHAANAMLCLQVLRSIYPNASSTLLGTAALLFTLHPSHVESTNWIAGVTDLQLSFFLLLSFLAYQRPQLGWLGISYATFALALLSKEVAVTFPLVVMAQDLLIRRRPAWWRWLGFVALVAGYFLLRTQALGESAAWGRFDLGQIGAAFAALGHYTQHIFFPWPNTYYHTPPTNPLLMGLGWGAILACLMLLIRHGRQREWSPLLGAVWFGAMLAPALALSLLDHPTFAQRFLYLPSIGITIFMVGVLQQSMLTTLRPRLIAAVLAAGFTLACWQAAWTWKDDKQFYLAGLKQTHGLQFYNGLAGYLVRSQEQGIGRRELLQIILTHTPAGPEQATALDMVATYAARNNRLAAGEWLFERLNEHYPDYVMGWMGRANVALLRGDYQAAGEFYLQALHQEPGNPQLCGNAYRVARYVTAATRQQIAQTCRP